MVVQRPRVMNSRVDARMPQCLGHAVPLVDPHREDVVDARCGLSFGEQANAAVDDRGVARGVAPACRVGGLEPTQLHSQERGLQAVEALVDARDEMLSLSSLAEVPKAPRALGKLAIIRADGASVPQRA